MASLVITQVSGEETRLRLREEIFTIGRHAGSDLHLDGPGVSRDHARIVCEDGVYFIEDLGSRLGTLVDGRPVRRERLWDGCAIEIATYRIGFRGDEPSADADATIGPGFELPAAVRRQLTVTADLPAALAATDSIGFDLDAGTGPDAQGDAVDRTTKLVVVCGGAVVGEHVLENLPISIGRGSENDIVLKGIEVSRRHATLTFDMTRCQFVVRDLDSANGTFVSGAPVETEAMIAHGAEISIGEFTLLFRCPWRPTDTAPADPSMPAEPLQGITLHEEMPATKDPDGGSAAREDGVAQGGELILVVRGGPTAGRTVHVDLDDLEELAIGRDEAAEIRLDDESVSRRHALITRTPMRLELQDLGSMNGTTQNGAPVDRCELAEGDLLQFGSIAVQVERLWIPRPEPVEAPAPPSARLPRWAVRAAAGLAAAVTAAAVIVLIALAMGRSGTSFVATTGGAPTLSPPLEQSPASAPLAKPGSSAAVRRSRPTSRTDPLESAQRALAAGQYQEARDQFSRVLAADPDQADANAAIRQIEAHARRLYRSNRHLLALDPERAREGLREVVAMLPDDHILSRMARKELPELQEDESAEAALGGAPIDYLTD
ncbi:MAG: FHA domain-containing protein [Candidatus Schekmanbacteria bacterium]|nr:FHA domain-containing protein [Candidatus Schekmanbacteria bacterium]